MNSNISLHWNEKDDLTVRNFLREKEPFFVSIQIGADSVNLYVKQKDLIAFRDKLAGLLDAVNELV